MACGITDIKCLVAEAVDEASVRLIDIVFEWFHECVGTLVAVVMTWWIELPTPLLSSGSKSDNPVAWMWGHTDWLSTWIAVLCLLLSAGKLAWSRRAEPAVEAAKGMVTFTVVTGSSVAAVNLLVQAGDSFSAWIITQAAGGNADLGKAVLGWLGLGSLVSPGLALILAVLATFVSLVQVALMLVRNVMLVLLAGTLPLSAAATSTTAGQAWFRKHLGWLIAFVLYKPVAAIVYATAFRMTADGGTVGGSDDVLTSVSGVMLMALALLALPALMRFVMPLVQAAGSAGSGSAAASGTGRAVAAGARQVPQMRTSSAPSPQPSGAPPSPPPPAPPAGGRPQVGISTTTTATHTSSAAPAAGGTAAKGAAASGGAAGGGAAAAGPVGVVVAGTVAVAKGVKNAADRAANDTGDGGPSGSR